MRQIRLLGVLTVLTLLLVLPVAAQSGSVQIDDAAGVLGSRQSQVEQAAQQLAAEDAEVRVVTSTAPTQADADAEIDALRDQITPNEIIFYVAPPVEYTAIYYGSRWTDALEPAQQRIQAEVMNPRFASGDIVGGFVAGIDAARTTINPPNTLAYVVGGALAATAAGAVAVPLLRRRRQTASDLQTAREQLEAARRAAGAAIADLGQLIETAQDKAAYDRISYAANDVERLTAMQSSGLSQFQAAQAAYDAAEEQQNMSAAPTARDFAAITARYNEAQSLAQGATEAIRNAESMRAMLDARGTANTGPTTRLD